MEFRSVRSKKIAWTTNTRKRYSLQFCREATIQKYYLKKDIA